MYPDIHTNLRLGVQDLFVGYNSNLNQENGNIYFAGKVYNKTGGELRIPTLNEFNNLNNKGDKGASNIAEIFKVSIKNGNYFINNLENRPINLYRGFNYIFELDVQGHPFQIQTGGDIFNQNLIYLEGIDYNNNLSENLLFSVPNDAPDILYYSCQIHPNMIGIINISNFNQNELKGIKGDKGDINNYTTPSTLTFSRILPGESDNWNNKYNWYGPKNIDLNSENLMYNNSIWNNETGNSMNKLNILGFSNNFSSGVINPPINNIAGGYNLANPTNKTNSISFGNTENVPIFSPQPISGKIIGYSLNYINNSNQNLNYSLPNVSVSIGLGKWIDNKWEFNLTGGLVTTGNFATIHSNSSIKANPECGYERLTLDINNFSINQNDLYKSYELPFNEGDVLCACISPFIDTVNSELYWCAGEVSITLFVSYNII